MPKASGVTHGTQMSISFKPPDLSKLEYLIDYMRQNDIGAWLIQETWEEGNEFDVDVDGYHIFRHNAIRGEKRPSTSLPRSRDHTLPTLL